MKKTSWFILYAKLWHDMRSPEQSLFMKPKIAVKSTVEIPRSTTSLMGLNDNRVWQLKQCDRFSELTVIFVIK